MYSKWFWLISRKALFILLPSMVSTAIAAAPKIACDAPTFDFGETEATQPVAHTFVLKNTGNAPLEISKTEAHCGCTVANITEKNLATGSESAITITVDLKGQKGHVIKTVDIFSNDPDQPQLTLSMDGIVLSSLNIVPDRLLFGGVADDSKMEKTIELIVNRPAVAHVRSVTSGSPNLEISTETLTDGEAYRLHVKLKPPLPAAGINDSIVVKTDRPGYESVSIPVLATVVGDVAVSPETIILTALPTPVNRYVILSPGKAREFTITKVQVPVDSMKAEVSTVSPGTYRIRLSNVLANEALVGKSLKISTNLPNTPTISIPFNVELPAAATQPSVAKDR